MKFVISTQELNYLINKCINVVPQKPTVPILGNFLIEASNGEVVITATDLTVAIRASLEAKIIEEGSTTVPARKFASLIRELTALNLELTTNEHHVTQVVADSSQFKINGMEGSEFPDLPPLTGGTTVQLNQEQLKDMFFRTAFAVSREDNRYTLTGVCLNIANGKATFVGTDGKRLARTHLDVDFDPSFTASIIIPIKAVEEISKSLEDEGTASLHLLDDKIAVETENTVFISKLLQGDYPDVSRVIPEKSTHVVSIHREELISLLRQVALFTTTENSLQSSVRFTLTNGELKLAANSSDVGEGKVSMPVNYSNEQLDIAFNPTLFQGVLRHCRGETVNFGLTDSFNPGVIMDCEVNDGVTAEASPLYVLMPMRLNDVA